MFCLVRGLREKTKKLPDLKAALFAGLLLWGLPLAAHSQQNNPSQPLVAIAAKKLGVKACLPAISQAAQENSAGANEQDIVVDWNRKVPDKSPFFSMTALGAGASHAALTIVAMPLGGQGCALMVQRVFSKPGSCSLIAQRELSSYVGRQLIAGVFVYSDPDHPEKTYTLMQTPQNCTVIYRNDIPKW